MWQGARVFKNWFFHPLHWPRPVLAVMFGVYLVSTGVVFMLHKKEQKDKSHDFYYRALDIRKRELANLKLSAIEPFIWKPLFACKGLEQEKKEEPRPENVQETPSGSSREKSPKELSEGECIKTSFAFSSPEEKKGYRPGEAGGVLYTGKIVSPCLICHPKKEGHTVTWSFHYPFVEPQTAATELWKSDDFTLFHLFLWLLFALYGGVRWSSHKNGMSDHFAAAIWVDSAELLDTWLGTKEGKKFYRNFFYAEHGPQYLRGYIPRKRFDLLMKKMMNGEIPIEAGGMRAGVVEYGPGELSYEGLRVAQALANKAPAGTIVIEENILPPAHEMGALKKAVWKKGNTPVYFRIVEL